MAGTGSVRIPRSANHPELSYLDTGGTALAPVVLLHSIGTDRRIWEQQVAPLSAGYRLLLPDSRGHGRSGWTEGDDLAVGDWVDDLDSVLDDAGVGAVSVVGLSMGGVQALAYALARPERVRGLVLADTFAELDAETARTKVTSLVGQARAGMAAFAGEYLRQTLTGDRVTARVRTALRDAISKVPVEAYVASARACFGVRLRARLGDVRPRTLVLWGALDSKTPRSLSDELAAGIPDARFEDIPEAGHLSPVENPSAFTDALTRFLDAVHDDTRTGRTDSWR
jgi:pimeloyl-ACP methyl ester carboxylesterase